MLDLKQHVDNMRDVMFAALKRAVGEVHDPADLYITGLETDGQYVTVSVGVANITDVRYTLDSTLYL